MKEQPKKMILAFTVISLLTSNVMCIGTDNITFAQSNTKLISRGVPRDAKNSGSFKSYMDFRCITDKNSEQYKFQKECMTDENGLRKWNYNDQDYYVVALGSYYSETIGTRFKVTLSDDGEEHSIYIVLGDCKQDIHTDDSNRFIEKNGNIIEFLVSQRDLPSLARKMGDVSYADDKLMGKIVKIEEIKD